MDKKDLRYSSIIPADRVFVNGNKSRVDAYVSWTIRDVYSLEKRSTTINSVKSGTYETGKDWKIFGSGVGTVPVRIEFNVEDDSKSVTIYF